MSSTITNIIQTVYRASGTQAISTSKAVGQSIGGITRQTNEAIRSSSTLNNQFRAIGTTIRYAIAGTAVFGLTRMVGQLKDVQVQMGLISAIGTPKGGGVFTNDQMTTLMGASRQGALEAITPIQDYNNAIINLLSTVQDIPAENITPIVTTISQAAQLAQVSSEDATKAFTTMNTAFGRESNLKNVKDIAQQFFLLTKLAPGGAVAGQQIITQLGQLAQMTRLAGGRPSDMFGLLLTTLRSGIPPAQAGRGLQFLLQTIGLPGQQVKTSREALESVGITPGANMTLQERLTRIFTRARQLGVRGNLNRLRNLDEESLANMEGMDPTAALRQVGVTGRGAEFLGRIFRRIHALRTALAIEQQINVGQAQDDLKVMQDAAEGHVADVNNLSKAWDRFAKRAQLKRAAVALDTLRLQLAEGLEPFLNLGAQGIVRGTQLAARHPRVTRVAETAGIEALVGYTLIRWLRGGRGLPVGRLFPGAMAAHSFATGAPPTGSAADPFYVVVMNDIFGRGTPPVVGAPGGPGGAAERTARTGRVARVARAATKPLIAFAAVDTANELTGRRYTRGHSMWEKDFWFTNNWGNIKQEWSTLGSDIWRGITGQTRTTVGDRPALLREARRRFGRRGEVITGVSDTKLTGDVMHGEGELTLTLNIKHPDGTKDKRTVKVPFQQWSNNRVPSSGGKVKSRR